MSGGEDLSLEQYWQDLPAADRDKRAWLEGPRISESDLLKGCARIQRVTARDWWAGVTTRGANGSAGQSARAAQGGGQAGAGAAKRTGPTGNVMGFGKYRERLMADVREDDPRYFAWCVAEVRGFEARARKAGLLEDEDEGGEDN